MWVSKVRRVRESSDAFRFRRVAASGIDTKVRSANPSLRVVKRFRWLRTALRQFLHLANLPRTMGSEFEGIGVADRYPMPSFKVPGFPPPACVESHPVLLGRLRLSSPVGGHFRDGRLPHRTIRKVLQTPGRLACRARTLDYDDHS